MPEQDTSRAKRKALLQSILFSAIVPGSVAGWIPLLINRTWPGGAPGSPWAWLLIIPAAAVLLETILRFAWEGLGTPAPLLPTQHLVVRGLYRYVRNPMYLAVLSVVIGQAILYGNPLLFSYAALLCCAFHLFVRFYEEPTLRRRYGVEYERYYTNVPRWVPRLRTYV